MTHPSPARPITAVDVVTVVHDQLRDEVLFTCLGAMLPPPGTLVELGGGERTCVTSVRMIAPTVEGQVAQVVVSVAPPPCAL
ncbi:MULTISPECIES: hypothetical protein [Amycolatopsis]|uniref:hypothetical protein n=1 Tax=Amycolatopsis TaxID=1813 RepID=UPI000E25F36C|nr:MULTISPECIES: hypothetical protein [Amycolatopsis]